MSFTNGIGDLKQALSSITQAATTTETQQVGSAKENGSSPTGAARVPQADEARLSSTGGLIAQSLEGSDVRTAKVEALQQAIANGTYSVSSSDVADKLIQSLLE
jgi:negative regulator of flagellin synthesis FlgM